MHEMRQVALLLLSLTVAHASVTVTRTSQDGPHPSTMEIEVELPDSDQTVLIPLTRTDAFNNVPVTVTENGVSRTFSARQLRHPSLAHYRDVDSKSVISVRHVNGKRRISGHVTHEGTSYFLEPVGESDYRVTENIAKTGSVDAAKLGRLASRRKRQSISNQRTANVVEILLLLDHSVWDSFKTIYADDTTALTELHYYYTHILNGVDISFRNIGSALSISVICTGITISKTAADNLWMPPAGSADYDQAGAILTSMMAYSVGKVADHVMAFTRTDIKGGTNSAVCGMAYTSAACTEARQSINEDQGLQSWGTAAHELAHNLGAEHDGDGNSCETVRKNLMSPQAGSYELSDVANSYRFSSCSVADMTKYITNLGSTSCLRTQKGTKNTNLASTVREGARMTLDQVCKLSFPSGSGKLFLSNEVTANPANICAKIFCLSGANSGTTMGGLRAPVGTPCGNRKSCNWNGACVADSTAPEADESCFWGDSWDADTCNGWSGYIKYQRENSDTAGAKSNCDTVRAGCCKTVKALCTF